MLDLAVEETDRQDSCAIFERQLVRQLRKNARSQRKLDRLTTTGRFGLGFR